MTKFTDIPDVIPLDEDSALCLSIACAGLEAFPSTLRNSARIKTHHLPYATAAKELSPYGLLSAAYVGVAPLPRSHRRFFVEVERFNRLQPHPLSNSFLTNPFARENSAASEFGMCHGEIKRLYKHLDTLAGKCAGISSYEAIVNCKQEILQDESPHAPAGRETFAEGSLHLWDFAKAVNENGMADMCFDTFSGWVLFVHLENGIASGHAIHPAAHRFGDMSWNKLIDIDEMRVRDEDLFPIIEVPEDVRDAVEVLANRHFAEETFEFYPPPMMHMGRIISSKRIRRELLLPWTED